MRFRCGGKGLRYRKGEKGYSLGFRKEEEDDDECYHVEAGVETKC